MLEIDTIGVARMQWELEEERAQLDILNVASEIFLILEMDNNRYG